MFFDTEITFARLHVAHMELRNPGQIARMVEVIRAGRPLPKVQIHECDDGRYVIYQGHHRCSAYYLAGLKSLPPGSFTLWPDYKWGRPYTLPKFVERLQSNGILPWSYP